MPQQKAAPQPPLKCHICNQSFSRKNSLRRHLQLHTGLKPYHCNTCSKSFARQDIYKRHMVSKRCLRLSEKKQMASNSPKEKD
ncbi:hypothetical protein CONCODRAFT_42766 [Conidiobolus coronatus NRRL 28638]|uniref:C2H2-type domain-containing protein n=1 Tax=Conidiobolus coronatus (strain ATCC 28846 / CBS 209.66 / NRRL 28638) TaxID=796925 RepID=A0A137NXV6_CONC2|nr:hypothetical protein CONCODRAFT_42766 [Conidiobolus coronatus NRRL 28638]|eukprot:KXN67532.1 hypothetical protein CONCODRAFT_42766 [Conidiobolus coronatus NRRL 28638]